MSPRRIAKALAIAGTVVLCAIVVVTVTVVRHRSQTQKLAAVAGLVPGALLHAHNFHWTQMKGDQSQWVLKARDASYSSDRTTLNLTDPYLSMTTRDGKSFSVSSQSAVLALQGNHVSTATLKGGVAIHYGEFVVTTEEATIAPDNDQLNAPGLVKIDGRGMSVSGVGLTGHPKAQFFELLKQVSTRIEPGQKVEKSKVS